MRMRIRIFRTFLGSAFALLLAALLAIDFYSSRYVERERVEAFRHRLESEARILAAQVPRPPTEAWAKAASAASEARVAIIAPDGSSIVDSQSGAEGEIRGEASVHGQVLRLSVPLADVTAPARDLRFRLLIATAAIALAGIIGGALFLRSFSRRASRLRAYIEGLLDPQLPDADLPSGDDELGALALSLRRAAPQIRELVERLKLESQRREAILASMVEGVLAVDRELRVTFCNNSFAHTIGVRPPVEPGVRLLELVRDPGLLEIMTSVLSTGQQVERRLMLPGTESHSFEVQAAPLAGPVSRGAIAILHDITTLDRLERVRRDFVANVSHELRTPLAAIRGYAETLLDGALDDEANNRKFVEVILAQATRLNNIASDLLILSELEAAGGAAQPKPISIRATLEAALRTVEPAARLRNVKLVSGRIEDVKVLGFEIRLEQAFVNLLDNAVKFNRPDGEVRIETSPVHDGRVAILFSDTGVGIPFEDLPRIFERFYRVDKARSRDVAGTGLGLSIVKHVIEGMKGAVTVDSQLGRGSRFTVYLPAAA
jgi:two-component system phosphate regulon sensor histidine kinase PhoR